MNFYLTIKIKSLPKCKFLFLLLVLLFCNICPPAHAQQVKSSHITLNATNESVTAVFDKISQSSGFTFFYDESVLENVPAVTAGFSNENLQEVLKKLTGITGLEFIIKEKTISVTKKKNPVANQVKQSPKTVTGVITDAGGEPIIGASVVAKGTTNGTVTDVDGKFNLAVPSEGILVITYIGFLPQEITVGNKTRFDIKLLEDNRLLDEIVVIGYGVQNRRDVSTSISSVKAEQLENMPVTDFRQSLAGTMAGVQVLQTSGDPEGKVSIRVRGISTATAGNEPLYVIDGVPVERGFMNMNNNDIESVEVLKDASSAAIYGSRGANGVILITTKKGQSEKLTVQYDTFLGTQRVSRKIPMLNAYQYAELSRDAHNNAYLDEVPGASPDDPNSKRPQPYHRIPPELFPYLNGEQGLTDTDWQDAIFRTAPIVNHNISFSGKGKNVNYFTSANYYKQEGVVINSDFERYSMRLNLDGKFNKFRFGVNFAPTYSHSNRVNTSGQYTDEGVVASALSMSPTWPVYNPDGSYNFQGNGYWRIGTDYQHNEVLNPVAIANLQKDQVDRVSLLGKTFAEYEFFKGFTYNISLGGDFYGAYNEKFRSSELPLRGYQYLDAKSNPVGSSSSSFYYNWILENKFNYNTVIKENHSINAVFVQSAQKETFKGNFVEATDYPNDFIQTVSGGTVSKGSSQTEQWSLASYLARVQYSYKGRYMASAALRTDGSSRFGKNNRWGYFPSASAAWRISDENFFKKIKLFNKVEDFKLRTSYGVTGNFQIGNYEHMATLKSDDYILGSGNGILSPGYTPSNIENPDLGWEQTSMVNIGFDVTMFKGLLGLSVEYYNSDTKDLLLNVPVPHITGHSTALMNIGKVNNRGWEILLTSQKQFKDFRYSVSANYAKNTNEVKALGPGNAPIIATGSVNHAYYITQVGKPIGSYYLLVQDGIFANSQQLKEYPHFDSTRPGDFRFVDVDGDGVLDVDKDRTIVGNYMPDFTYGFNGTLGYKSFDLSFNFQGVYGNEILNLSRRYNDNMEGNFNGTVLALDRWQSEDNPGSGEVNRANRKTKGNNGRTSTWHIEDGSYLRLQNLAIGYTLPRKLINRISADKLRFYVSAQNLFTITKYTGYNPEVSNRPDNALTPGEDYGTYPLARTFTFGLNLTF